MTPNESLRERFNELAGKYDEFAGQVPAYRDLQNDISDLLSVWFTGWTPGAVLELGPGEGRRMEWILDRIRPDHYDLVDLAGDMLEVCREKLSRYGGKLDSRLIEQSFEGWEPDRSYDLIHSALSIHHLASSDRQALFGRLSSALRPGGRMLLADVVRSPAEWGTDHYRLARLRSRRSDTMSEEEFTERWQGHLLHDNPARWEQLLFELRQAGFRDVDLVYKHHNYVVFVGRGGLPTGTHREDAHEPHQFG